MARFSDLPPHIAERVLSMTGGAAPKRAKPNDLRALGRMKAGEMNQTEARYDTHLLGERLAGRVLWHRFEAIKLQLAPKTSLTVDFAVLPVSGVLEMHDVKGSLAIYADDAKAKMKIAADLFPFVFRLAVPRAAKDGGGWEIIDV